MKNSFNFPVFARQLMQEATDVAGQPTEQAVRVSQRKMALEGCGTSSWPHLQEGVALAVADLVALSQMLLANLVVREAHNLWLKGDVAGRGQVPELNGTGSNHASLSLSPPPLLYTPPHPSPSPFLPAPQWLPS